MKNCSLISVLLILLSTSYLSSPSAVHSKEGSFFLVGGGCTEAIRDQFVKDAGGEKARLVLIPGASSTYIKEDYLHTWIKYKVESIDIIDNPDDIYKLKKATGVWLSGGCQMRLFKRYNNTPLKKELQHLYFRGGIIGGTSAGASIVGSIMPFYDKCCPGFGLLEYLVIDQHFSERKREARLKKIIESHAEYFGLGLDEGAAVIISGNIIEVLGTNKVTVFKPTKGKKIYQIKQR